MQLNDGLKFMRDVFKPLFESFLDQAFECGIHCR